MADQTAMPLSDEEREGPAALRGALADGQGPPAGLEPHRLCKQNQPLTVITQALLKTGALFPDKGNVVLHAGELAVMGHEAVKGLGLIRYKLDVQAVLLVAGVDFLLQGQNVLRLQRDIFVAAHRMAGLHGF